MAAMTMMVMMMVMMMMMMVVVMLIVFCYDHEMQIRYGRGCGAVE